MPAPTEATPSLPRVRAALARTTEDLATLLAEADGQLPAWSPLEWRVACAVASLHGVAPLLARIPAGAGPAPWQRFLEDQRAQTVARTQRWQRLLAAVDAECRRRGIPFVGLKGVALHAMALYEPGDRPMADLDLLIRPADLAGVDSVLRGLGYLQTGASWKERVYEDAARSPPGNFGERADNALKIDLHTQVSERLPRRPVRLTRSLLPEVLEPGLNPYPGRAALMDHLLLHAAGEMVLRTLRLIQLNDLARLCGRMQWQDWEVLLVGGGSGARRDYLYPPLALLAHYYRAVPQPVLERAAAVCSLPVRRGALRLRISRLSYSELYRHAFPGLQWSAGIFERSAYVGARLAVAARALVRHRPAPESGDSVSGQQVPQRWHGLRPVRRATLHAVQTALTLWP